MGSRVSEFFYVYQNNQFIPITDERMTRFVISLDKCVELVSSFKDMQGGNEVKRFIYKITDIAKVIVIKLKFKLLIRPGKLRTND